MLCPSSPKGTASEFILYYCFHSGEKNHSGEKTIIDNAISMSLRDYQIAGTP